MENSPVFVDGLASLHCGKFGGGHFISRRHNRPHETLFLSSSEVLSLQVFCSSEYIRKDKEDLRVGMDLLVCLCVYVCP